MRPFLIRVATFSVLGLLALPQAGWTQTRRVKPTGIVVSVAPGEVLMADTDGNARKLNIPKDLNVVAVQGMIAISDLKPGMLIRVSGTLKGTTLEGEIAQATVYSPTDGYAAEIVQPAKDQPTMVTGILQKEKEGTLSIQVGRKRIAAKLAKDAVISVDSKDYNLAPVGARIEADGYTTKNGSINAKKVVITLGPKGVKEQPPDEKEPKKKTAK